MLANGQSGRTTAETKKQNNLNNKPTTTKTEGRKVKEEMDRKEVQRVKGVWVSRQDVDPFCRGSPVQADGD